MSNPSSFPNHGLYLFMINTQYVHNLLCANFRDWVDSHKDEKRLNSDLSVTIRYAHVVYSRDNYENGFFQNEILSQEIVNQLTRELKSLYIDRLFRQTGSIKKVFLARYAQIVASIDTVASFHCHDYYPHTAIVLRQLDDCLVCHIANLDCGGFGNGVYGEEAKSSFIERVNRAIGNVQKREVN